MKISILCSNTSHPVVKYLKNWMETGAANYCIELVHASSELTGGDILFLISCTEIVTADVRAKYNTSLVFHASDLPNGRGWSPHIWELLGGAEILTLSVVEAEDRVDAGRIWNKVQIYVPKHALWNEINHLLFTSEVEMMDFVIKNYDVILPKSQVSPSQATYYPRRNSGHSQIDPEKSIAEQFDLIRVCDPIRYPAYFDYLGHRFLLKLERPDE